MKLFSAAFLMIGMLAITSCATSKTKLTSKGMAVKIFSKRSHQGCEVVDKVIGKNEKGSEPLARNHARNLTGAAGGNGMVVDEVVTNSGKVAVYATAYICP